MLSALKDIPMIGKKLEQVDDTTAPTMKLEKLRFTELHNTKLSLLLFQQSELNDLLLSRITVKVSARERIWLQQAEYTKVLFQPYVT